MTTYHALQILGWTGGPMSVQQIDAKAIDQANTQTLTAELETARAEGLVTYSGGMWELTDSGRDLYST